MKIIFYLLLITTVIAVQQGRRRRRRSTVCSKGEYAFEKECLNCPNNTFRPDESHMQTECIKCQSGRATIHSKATFCVGNICTPGKYGEIGKTECKECPAGKYSDLGSFWCKKCKSGQYNPDKNQDKCLGVPCKEGEYGPDGITSKDKISCQTCTRGKYSSIGSNDCIECPKETYSLEGASYCINHTMCGVGHFTNNYYNYQQKTCENCYKVTNVHYGAFILSVFLSCFWFTVGCLNCNDFGFVILFMIPSIVFSCLIGACSNVPLSMTKVYVSFAINGILLIIFIYHAFELRFGDLKNIICCQWKQQKVTVIDANRGTTNEISERQIEIQTTTNYDSDSDSD